MTEKLACPICGCEFLRVNKSSKTCSYECSHKLVKRRPRLAIYRQPKEAVDLMADILREALAAQ